TPRTGRGPRGTQSLIERSCIGLAVGAALDRWAIIGTMEQLKRVYAAFNARDLDTATSLMHPDVDWPNGWEGGRIQGRDAVRDYWTRQWESIRSNVEPLDFTESGHRVAVTVRQVIRDLDGN